MNPKSENEIESDIFPWHIFKSDIVSFLWKHIKVFQWLLKSEFISFMTKLNPNNWNETKSDIFPWHIFKSGSISFFFYRNILKYFNDFQLLNFSVLLLKLTQTIKMKENQTFFHVTYSNLTTYLFSSKNIKVFEWLLNRTFWVLWLKWTQTMEMKQSQTFFHSTFLNLTLFSLVVKYQNISVISIISTFQSHCKSDHKQVTWNKITQEISKLDGIFHYVQSRTLFKWYSKFTSWCWFTIKGNWTNLAQKNSQAEVKINTIFRLLWKCLICLIIKTF